LDRDVVPEGTAKDVKGLVVRELAAAARRDLNSGLFSGKKHQRNRDDGKDIGLDFGRLRDLLLAAGGPGVDGPQEFLVNENRLTIFIDPLDGTCHYAAGEFREVTTLVGIVLDNEPIFGVICKPFGQCDDGPRRKDGGPIHVRDCFALYGGPLVGGVHVAGSGGERIDPMGVPGRFGKDGPRAVVSRGRHGGAAAACVDALAAAGTLSQHIVPVGGAGQKVLRMLVGGGGEALWPFPRPGTSLWDVAAADALLRGVGGVLTDASGGGIDYSVAGSRNDGGVVASICSDLHKSCIEVLLKGAAEEEDGADEGNRGVGQ